MDLSLSDDQRAVRAAFADFFAKESPISRVREVEPLGFDLALWTSLSATGAVLMGVAEQLGGGAASAIERALVAEEHGRRLAPVPLVEAVVATSALAAAPGGRQCLEPIALGEVIPTIALGEHVERWGNTIYGITLKVRDLASAEAWLEKKGIQTEQLRPDVVAADPDDCLGAPYFFTTETVPGDPFDD